MKSKYQSNKGAKPKNYAPGDNIYLWCLSVTTRAGPPRRGKCTRML